MKSKILYFFVAFALVFSLFGSAAVMQPASAVPVITTIRYVDNNWTNVGGSWKYADPVVVRDALIWETSAFRSIQAAIDAASAGDSVLVYPGTYEETLLIDKNIVVQSIKGARNTIITGAEIILEIGGKVVVVAITADGATFEGFTVLPPESLTRKVVTQSPELEIVTGSDEMTPVIDNYSARGLWRMFDSEGNLLWWKDTFSDEARSSVAFIDLNSDQKLEIVGGTTSGETVEVMDEDGNWVWTFPTPPRFGNFMWHSSPAVANVHPTNGLEVIIGNRSLKAMFCFDGDNSDGVDDGITAADHVADIGTWEGVEGTDWDLLWYYKTTGDIISTPAVADINNDGQMEVVFGAGWNGMNGVSDGKVYCLNGIDGTLKWSYQTGGTVVDASPALGNLDSDPALEVVIGASDGKIYVIDNTDGNGTIDTAEVTSTQTVVVGTSTPSPVHSSAAIGDVDADQTNEFVIGSNNGFVYCFNYDPGAATKLVQQWYYQTAGGTPPPPPPQGQPPTPWEPKGVISSPALANRGYGGLDVYVCGTDGNLYILKGDDGSLISKYETGGNIVTSPGVGDVDGDGKLEVLFTADDITLYDQQQNPRVRDVFYCVEDATSNVTPYIVEWSTFRNNPDRTGYYNKPVVTRTTGQVTNSIDLSWKYEFYPNHTRMMFGASPAIGNIKATIITYEPVVDAYTVGVYVSDTTGVKVAGNLVEGFTAGILVNGTENNITGNRIQRNMNGVAVEAGSANQIGPCNRIMYNVYGVVLGANTTANYVKGSTIYHNWYGVWIDGDSNIIEENNIIYNKGANQKFEKQTEVRNAGVYLVTGAALNEIHNNNIIDNSVKQECTYNVLGYGVYNEGQDAVNARGNWWGDASGPYHKTSLQQMPDNQGGLGDAVSDYVDYANRLTSRIAAKYTVMVYLDGDNDLEEWTWMIMNELEIAGSTPYVNVVVLWDRSGYGDTVLYEILPDPDMGNNDIISRQIVNTTGIIGASGEANMGRAATLSGFINWARTGYPAENEVLVMWDHGAGWRNGLCIDWNVPNKSEDSLDLYELSDALSVATTNGANKLDLIVFDACLMDEIEVDYQIKDYANYVLGSEEVTPAPGFAYAKIMTRLTACTGDMSVVDFGKLIVDEYDRMYNTPEQIPTLYAATGDSGMVYRYMGYGEWSPISWELDDSVECLEIYKDEMYAGTINGYVYKYSNEYGYNDWEQVGYLEYQDSGEEITDLIWYNCNLYASTYANNSGRLYKYISPNNWEVIANLDYGLSTLGIFDGYLYIGTMDNTEIWKWDGISDCEKVYTDEDSDAGVNAFEEFDGKFYAVTGANSLYSTGNGTEWTVDVAGMPVMIYTNDMEIYNESLYTSTSGLMGGTLKVYNPSAIPPEMENVWGGQQGLRTLENGGDYLYIGSTSIDGAAVYQLKIDGDTVIEENNISVDSYLGERVNDLLYTGEENLYPFPIAQMALKDLSKMEAVAVATDNLATALITSMPLYQLQLAGIGAKVERFWPSSESVDLYHFAQLVAGIDGVAAPVLGVANQVMAAIDEAVIYEMHGVDHPNAHGIAIYYPYVNRLGQEPVYGQPLVESGPVIGSSVSLIYYDPSYKVKSVFGATKKWDNYLKRAPRWVAPGIVAVYIPDFAMVGVVTSKEGAVVRFNWPQVNEYGLADEYSISKPLDVVVLPEGAIDLGVLAMLYTKADLDAANIAKTQIIGVARNVNQNWQLEKFTMKLPEWVLDTIDLISGLSMFIPINLDVMLQSLLTVKDVMPAGYFSGMPNYTGAVIDIPWLNLSNIAPEAYKILPNLPMVSSKIINSYAIMSTTLDQYWSPLQYPQNLYKGWNAISLPVIPINNDVEAVLSGNGGVVEGVADSVDAVWTYDAETKTWNGYSPDAVEASNMTEMNDGAGYWVKTSEDTTLTVVGSNALIGPFTPPTYELYSGWNFIGYKGILPMPTEYKVRGNDYWEYIGYLSNVTYAYDPSLLTYYNRLYSAYVYNADVMFPNDGYWIYIDSSESVTLPGMVDGRWVKAVERARTDWFAPTATWLADWMLHDAELGLRLSWNALWYVGNVIAPSEISYWEKVLDLLNMGLPI